MQAAEHAETEARDAADGNSRATDIFISGVKGSGSPGNGLYKPQRTEICCNRIVYKKEGDDDWWLEHYGGTWQLKQRQQKGKDDCWAFAEGACALEECGSQVWQVALTAESPFVEDTGINLAVGEKAQALSPEGKARKTIELLQRLGLQDHTQTFM